MAVVAPATAVAAPIGLGGSPADAGIVVVELLGAVTAGAGSFLAGATSFCGDVAARVSSGGGVTVSPLVGNGASAFGAAVFSVLAGASVVEVASGSSAAFGDGTTSPSFKSMGSSGAGAVSSGATPSFGEALVSGASVGAVPSSALTVIDSSMSISDSVGDLPPAFPKSNNGFWSRCCAAAAGGI